MRKPQKIIIISAMLIFLVAGCAATPRRTGLNQPMPSPEDATLLQEESRSNSQLNEIKSGQEKTNTLLERLVFAMENKTTAHVQAQAGAVKTATAADFRRTPENIETKGPTAKVENSESKRLKALESKVKELNATAAIHAVALMGKSDKYQIFRIHSFAAGKSSLKHDNMEKQINNLILRVEKLDLKYLRIIGYTNADGDKDNMELSGTRAKAVLDHITMYRPDYAKGIEPEKGGETKDFGITEENRCVIVVCEQKTNTP